MSVQEIGGSGKSGKERLQGYPCRKRKEHSERFQESLMQNLKYQEQDGREKAGSEGQRIDTVSMEKGRLVTGLGIRVNAVTRREAVQAAEVRHMSYEESDNIEIAVTEGYTLKGKLEGSQVYVEAKYDDGRLEAYRVDMERVPQQTQHRIERFAMETAEGMKSSETEEEREEND